MSDMIVKLVDTTDINNSFFIDEINLNLIGLNTDDVLIYKEINYVLSKKVYDFLLNKYGDEVLHDKLTELI